MRRREVLGSIAVCLWVGTTGCLEQSAGGNAIVSAKPVDSIPADETVVEYSEKWLRESGQVARAIREAGGEEASDVWREIPRSTGERLASRLRSEYPGADEQFPYYVRYEGTVVRISILQEG